MNEPEYTAILAAIIAGKAIREELAPLHADIDDYQVGQYYIDLAKHFIEAVQDTL